jgi:hypothetical protein
MTTRKRAGFCGILGLAVAALFLDRTAIGAYLVGVDTGRWEIRTSVNPVIADPFEYIQNGLGIPLGFKDVDIQFDEGVRGFATSLSALTVKTDDAIVSSDPLLIKARKVSAHGWASSYSNGDLSMSPGTGGTATLLQMSFRLDPEPGETVGQPVDLYASYRRRVHGLESGTPWVSSANIIDRVTPRREVVDFLEPGQPADVHFIGEIGRTYSLTLIVHAAAAEQFSAGIGPNSIDASVSLSLASSDPPLPMLMCPPALPPGVPCPEPSSLFLALTSIVACWKLMRNRTQRP